MKEIAISLFLSSYTFLTGTIIGLYLWLLIDEKHKKQEDGK